MKYYTNRNCSIQNYTKAMSAIVVKNHVICRKLLLDTINRSQDIALSHSVMSKVKN